MFSPDDDLRWLALAIRLSEKCPPSASAFSVGALIIDENGTELSRGFSRERPHFHAEESALDKLESNDERLRTATLYSSLEPCTRRRSRPRTCTELIISAGIRRVVIAWREPPIFVPDAHGAGALRAAGIEVVEYPELAAAAAGVNAALMTGAVAGVGAGKVVHESADARTPGMRRRGPRRIRANPAARSSVPSSDLG